MREIKYTARFQRDYRREKSGRHGKKLDALLMEVVNLPPPTRRCLAGISITHCPANGATTATATSGRISSSSTASRMTTASSLCALGRIVSLRCETVGIRLKLDQPFGADQALGLSR